MHMKRDPMYLLPRFPNDDIVQNHSTKQNIGKFLLSFCFLFVWFFFCGTGV
jgi:hypothetical protein